MVLLSGEKSPSADELFAHLPLIRMLHFHGAYELLPGNCNKHHERFTCRLDGPILIIFIFQPVIREIEQFNNLSIC